MIFEPMQKEHLTELAKMYVEAFNAPPWNDEWTIDTVTKRLLQMMNCEGFSGLICLKENLICGMILGNSEPFFDCTHFNIKEFCVRLSLRGTGIGTDLLNEFEKLLLEQGIDETYLFTSRMDETERYYQKRGYSSWNSMVMMGKSLH
jgi:aminoglycoside 6'-N-acetyltransferase I